jgi:hypothetical protein
VISLQPTIAEIEKTMFDRGNEIQRIKENMNNVEDKVFTNFCEQIGVANIRQYEERELRYYKCISRSQSHFTTDSQSVCLGIEYPCGACLVAAVFIVNKMLLKTLTCWRWCWIQYFSESLFGFHCLVKRNLSWYCGAGNHILIHVSVVKFEYFARWTSLACHCSNAVHSP